MTDYGHPKDEAERAQLTEVLCESFGFGTDVIGRYLLRAGPENQRVLRVDGRVAAGLVLLPMGQFFGGSSVRTTGFAAVGVAPEHRGTGIGRELMLGGLREAQAGGSPLATLYPSSPAFYRKCGFELAGSRYCLRIPTDSLGFPRDPDIEVRELGAQDTAEMEALWRLVAARRTGYLDRCELIWWRARHGLDGAPARLYGAFREGQLGGYLAMRQERGGRRAYDLALNDLVASDHATGRALLRFLGGHRTMAGDVVWHGSAHDPLLTALPEATYEAQLTHHWMVAVLDVARALEQRGFLPGPAHNLRFEVESDSPLLSSGSFSMTVDGGRARVEACGGAPLQLSARALAALFTGFLSPWELQRAGMLTGPEADLELAAQLFAGPSPTMSDQF